MYRILKTFFEFIVFMINYLFFFDFQNVLYLIFCSNEQSNVALSDKKMRSSGQYTDLPRLRIINLLYSPHRIMQIRPLHPSLIMRSIVSRILSRASIGILLSLL